MAASLVTVPVLSAGTDGRQAGPHSRTITTADAGHATRNSSVARTSAGTASRVVTAKPKLGNQRSAVVVSR